MTNSTSGQTNMTTNAKTDANRWIAQRTAHFDSSGIRRVFDLAAKLKNPINLSIGQPHFDVPEPVKESMIRAIQAGRNGYSPTQGIAPLRERLLAEVQREFPGSDRKLLVTSGTSGALNLAMLAMVDPGDEVIIFDPYFVMYAPLVRLASGIPVLVDTDAEFQIDLQRFVDALSPQTKLVLLNSPSNPTGVCLNQDSVKEVAEICAQRNIALISDEIYRHFCFDTPFVSPANFNADTIVVDGFSKSHAMTGWRLGFVHGPAEVVETMTKLQQYTYVCAPQPVQWAGISALDCDITPYMEDYRQKRDRLYDGLKDHYEIVKPDGAFYMYPKLPWGSGQAFVEKAIEHELLVIPGNIFSRHDTHFRLSFANSDEQLNRGIEVLQKIA
jgi:aspartate/methionine/tyrosine aminotransferase